MIPVVILLRFVRHLRVIEEEDMQIFVDADACPDLSGLSLSLELSPLSQAA